MNATKLIITLALFYVPILARADILGGPVTNAANGHLYYLLTRNTWTDAEAEAENLGGHLATINDAFEQAFVFATFGAFAGTSRSLWIGLTDKDKEGDFIWINGEHTLYRNWGAGEPNNVNNNEDYTQIRDPMNPQAGTWNDAANSATNNYGVVEVDPAVRLQIQVMSVAIRWNSHSNTMYQVEYASALAPTIWQSLGDPVQGSGTNNVVFDSVSDGPRRFYRVTVLP